MSNAFLEVQHLTKHFPLHNDILSRLTGKTRTLQAVDDISFFIPTTPLSLALCLSALPMCKIRLVIAPLEPGHKGEALLNRLRMEGQHNLE
jgi:hypothetical protein